VPDVRQRPVEIRQLGVITPREVVSVLARAFYPDPVFSFFARDRLHEYSLLASIFQAFVADTKGFDTTWVAEAGDQIVGGAVWLPPAGMPRGARREIMLNVRTGRVLARARNRVAGFKLLDKMDRLHPHDPHWYLMLLGTDPLVQGKGVGGRLLQEGLARADADGLPCYLETQKEENLAFYGRHGFVARNTIEVRGAPTVWTMQREPKAS
jgi:GNAT superfamily N-acetyltransferase